MFVFLVISAPLMQPLYAQEKLDVWNLWKTYRNDSRIKLLIQDIESVSGYVEGEINKEPDKQKRKELLILASVLSRKQFFTKTKNVDGRDIVYADIFADNLPDQKNDPLCYLFSIKGAIESAYYRETNSKVDFSAKYWLDKNFESLDSTFFSDAFQPGKNKMGFVHIAKRFGACLEKSYPFRDAWFPTTISSKNFVDMDAIEQFRSDHFSTEYKQICEQGQTKYYKEDLQNLRAFYVSVNTHKFSTVMQKYVFFTKFLHAWVDLGIPPMMTILLKTTDIQGKVIYGPHSTLLSGYATLPPTDEMGEYYWIHDSNAHGVVFAANVEPENFYYLTEHPWLPSETLHHEGEFARHFRFVLAPSDLVRICAFHPKELFQGPVFVAESGIKNNKWTILDNPSSFTELCQ